MSELKKDERPDYLEELEKNIEDVSVDKDSTFVLKGPWKRFIEEKEGLKIYEVDDHWVHTNLSVLFNHGGHGLVHEFIPIDEIWVGKIHFNCTCKNVVNLQPVSLLFFNSTIHHEITELKEMKKGKTYWEAHQIALQAELDLGLLTDPYSDPV